MRYKVATIVVIAAMLLSCLQIQMPINSATPTLPTAGNILYVGSTSSYKNIQDAINASQPGDTIIVDIGIYNENLSIIKNNITLRGNNSLLTVVNASNNIGIYLNGDWINISGFNILTTGNTQHYGIYINHSENCKVKNNNITTLGDEAIGINLKYSNHSKISYNNISTSGQIAEPFCHGVSLFESSNNTFYGNNISTINQSCYGFKIDSNSEHNIIIQNNITTQKRWGYGAYLHESVWNSFLNNTINCSGPFTHGIFQLKNSNHTEIIGNTILTIDQARAGVFITGSSFNDISDNIISTLFNNAYGIHLGPTTVPYIQSLWNNVTNNTIMTTDQNSYGIHLEESNNNSITLNTITTSGNQGHGIYLQQESLLNEINNNNISTSNTTSYGIQLKSRSDNNKVYENNINTDEQNGYGISFDQSSNNTATWNEINTSGQQGHGIHISSNADNNTMVNNTINTSATSGYGIYQWQSMENRIIGNTINIQNPSAVNAHGMIIGQSAENFIFDNIIEISSPSAKGVLLTQDTKKTDVINNTISTTGTSGEGIKLNFNVNYINLMGNTITTSKAAAHGISLDQSSNNNNITDNTIETLGNNAFGIYLQISTVDNNLIENRINTSGDGAFGIYLQDSSDNNTLSRNIINTFGSQNGYGIYLYDSDFNSFDENTINTNNLTGFGVFLNQSSNNTLTDNSIKTTGQGAHGLYLINASNCTLFGDSITTSGGSAHGVFISQNSNKTHLSSININTVGTTAFAFLLAGENATIEDSTINSQNSLDFNVTNNGNITSINCIFKSVEVTKNGGGVLQVWNYLHVLVYYSNGITPIPGADVEVTDNGAHVYATPGYSGSEPTTNVFGRVNNILLTDRWYIRNNIPIENMTGISVKKTVNLTWEGNRFDVDMSSTHTEVFIAGDIIAPPMPTDLKVARLPGSNTLKISWTPNPDTANYSVFFSVGGCAFTEIFNVSHPTNWTLHMDLDDGLEYQYKIRAWDQVGLSSPFTNIVSFTLTDITPPAVPTNFSVKPVLDGDKLILNWDRNFDDTVNYDIYWTESLTRAWQKLINISHPTNSTTWSDFVIVNGSTHYFKIRAWDEVPLASAFTLPVSVVHRDYIEPDTPTNLNAIAQSEHIIDLSWPASLATDVEGYRLYINQSGADSGGPYKFLAETDKLTLDYEVGNLLENVAYYFVVSAFDEANNPSPLSIWAKATTLAIPPAIPVLDELPDYTNMTKLDVTGTAELDTTVLVINNNLEAGNVSTDAEGIFRIEIDLEENANVINVHAVDHAKLASNDSESQVVILDTTVPIADCGPDINVSLGEAVIFNASGSSDNNEIGNYSWDFEYLGDEYVSVYGRENVYIFDSPGIYEVTLKVTDLAGNWAVDVLSVNVILVVLPIVEHTIPPPNEQDLPITETVTITFNTTMNTTTVENALSVSPSKNYNLDWSDINRVLIITFETSLKYNTEYIITIAGTAASSTGGLLEEAPFILKFKTMVKPQPVSINITSHTEDPEVKPGEIITVSGSSTGLPQGTEVKVTIGGEIKTTEIGEDGTWSISIIAPKVDGNYTLEVSAGSKTEWGNIIVKTPKKVEDDDDDGMFGFGPSMDWIIILIILIVIILIIVVLVLRKKRAGGEVEGEEEGVEEEEEGKTEEEKEEEEGEEEVVEEDEEEDLAEPEEPVDEEEPIEGEEPVTEAEAPEDEAEIEEEGVPEEEVPGLEEEEPGEVEGVAEGDAQAQAPAEESDEVAKAPESEEGSEEKPVDSSD